MKWLLLLVLICSVVNGRIEKFKRANRNGGVLSSLFEDSLESHESDESKEENNFARSKPMQQNPVHSQYYVITVDTEDKNKATKNNNGKNHNNEQFKRGNNFYGKRVYNWKQDLDKWPRTVSKKNISPKAMPPPPPPAELARMARYTVHNAGWTTLATTSTMAKIRGYPFANVISMSDGLVKNGSGIPFLYITELDMSTRDLTVDRRASLSISLAATEYCSENQLDPQDPRCTHVILTGDIYKIKNGTQLAKLAKEALFSRHPAMKTWPADHLFFFATMKIKQVVVLDNFGGANFISVDDYFNAKL